MEQSHLAGPMGPNVRTTHSNVARDCKDIAMDTGTLDGAPADTADDIAVDAGYLDSDCNTTKVAVLKKFRGMCEDKRLTRRVDSLVLRANVIVAEAYALANFHLKRGLLNNAAMPELEDMDKFYYACLASVTVGNFKPTTVCESIRESAALFDQLRPHGEDRVCATDLMPLLADLRRVMATAAKNHLWTNLPKRARRWLSLKHPRLKGMHGAIISAAFAAPTVPLEQFNAFRITDGLTDKGVLLRRGARDVAATLRSLCPLKRAKRVDSRSHELIPFFWRLFQDAEDLFQARLDASERGEKLKRTPMPRFNLLPKKEGFTTSYVPISTRTMLQLVSSITNRDGGGAQYMSTNPSDVGPEEADRIWRRWFNINSIETSTRRFGHLILTDGCGVRVILDRPASHVLSTESGEWNPEAFKTQLPLTAAGIDPGYSDVVTISRHVIGDASTPTTTSYSSSRYYEKAKYKVSKRRTDRWNEQTKDVAADLLVRANAATDEGLRQEASLYLTAVRRLVVHRMSRGYRNMRFMRAVGKMKAVDEICDIIAPRGMFTIIGYGNWTGDGSPVSRRYAGPQQDIKRELLRRTKTAALRSIDEFRTSILCSVTWQRMVNMKAVSHTRDRDGVMLARRKSKIHKVLHCKTSVPGVCRTETTWNRDVNASRNILMLLMLELHGFPRPAEFCRPSIIPRRRAPRVRRA
jgi:hypothetical protein